MLGAFDSDDGVGELDRAVAALAHDGGDAIAEVAEFGGQVAGGIAIDDLDDAGA